MYAPKLTSYVKQNLTQFASFYGGSKKKKVVNVFKWLASK